jgi:hypothetical protein
MTQRIPFKWGNSNFTWDAINPFPNQSITPFTWDDVALIVEVLEGFAGGKSPDDTWKDEEKKKRFIKLLCKVQGKEYKETKEIKKYKIRISDVALVAKEVLGVNIKVDL